MFPLTACTFDFEEDASRSFCILDRLKIQYSETKDVRKQWAIIRQGYSIMYKYMKERSKNSRMISPYFFDFCKHFTPIEFDVWFSIRTLGIPLYPQFPVLQYFIDFADPFKKIGIEVDGKDWHDEKKDYSRDGILNGFGWKIYRIKGSQTMNEESHDIMKQVATEHYGKKFDEEEFVNWLGN